AEARLRLARPAVAAAAALSWFRFGSGWFLVRVGRVLLFLFRFRLRDREDDEARVGRERRSRAARLLELLSAAQVAHDDLAVVALRRRGVGEPLPVVREARPLDRLPGVDDVVGERALGGNGGLRSQRPLKCGERAGDGEQRPAAQRLWHAESLLKWRHSTAGCAAGAKGAKAASAAVLAQDGFQLINRDRVDRAAVGGDVGCFEQR